VATGAVSRRSRWIAGGATFSADRAYRHVLWRARHKELGEDLVSRLLGVIMLNPSIAGEDPRVNDMTIIKLRGYCDRWGYRRFQVANLYDLVATDQRMLYQRDAFDRPAVSSANASYIANTIRDSDCILVAWGGLANLDARGRAKAVLDQVRLAGKELVCIGVTANGDPLHPSRAPYCPSATPYTIT